LNICFVAATLIPEVLCCSIMLAIVLFTFYQSRPLSIKVCDFALVVSVLIVNSGSFKGALDKVKQFRPIHKDSHGQQQQFGPRASQVHHLVIWW